MNLKKWIFASGIVAAVLIAVVLLVPLALAQGPADNTSPALTPQAGPGVQQGIVGPSAGSPMVGRGQGMMGGRAAGPLAQPGQAGRGPGFVDNDGDGVCDNFVDENGDGVCDRAGIGQGGRGPGFVDNDGDGVCDHAGTGQGGGPRRGRMAQGQMLGRWGQGQ